MEKNEFQANGEYAWMKFQKTWDERRCEPLTPSQSKALQYPSQTSQVDKAKAKNYLLYPNYERENTKLDTFSYKEKLILLS